MGVLADLRVEGLGGRISAARQEGEGQAGSPVAVARSAARKTLRAPEMMRFGFAPAYLGYADIQAAAEAFNDVMTSGIWREDRFAKRRAVT